MCGITLPTDERLIVGAETCDDAGVYRLNDETALIQTLDFFTPIVDDPYQFGQITAANALSDVYAMGGKPILAMNILACPIKSMDANIFREVIRGGLSKVEEAGALLVGGHSIEDDELKYGLSVTGTVHPDRVLLNSGAKAGDHLLLTKPLGTGILSTALKGGLSDLEMEKEMAEIMATLNKDAADAVTTVRDRGYPVNACTDITGFGLLGHLYEMVAASHAGCVLHADTIPLLPHTLDFINMGIIPEGAHTNRTFYRKHLISDGVEGDSLEISLMDPQTSGGLLIAAPAESIREILNGMKSLGYPLACADIGEITEEDSGLIRLQG